MAGPARRVASVLLGVISAGLAGSGAAQEPEPKTVRISGRVIDAATGDPLPGAVLVVEGTEIRLETDPGGNFELNAIPLGFYRLRLSHPGYDPVVDDFPVVSDRGFVLAMHPAREAPEAGEGRAGVGVMTGIMGILTASDDGSPLVGAAVRVDSGRGGVLTDERGGFTLDGLAPGLHIVEFAQIGYATRSDTVRVLPGHMTSVQASLSVDPVDLDPLRVVVERREAALQDAGFYERRADGWGKFFDREDIETRAPAEMTDLFTGIPGVTVETRGTRRKVVLRSGRVTLSNGYCYPRVFLDGILVHDGGREAAGIDDLVNPDAVAGIEVYPSSAGLPARYSSMTAGCGVLLIWTRR